MSGTGKYPKLIEGLRDAVAELQLPVSTSAEASIKQDKEISPGSASATAAPAGGSRDPQQTADDNCY